MNWQAVLRRIWRLILTCVFGLGVSGVQAQQLNTITSVTLAAPLIRGEAGDYATLAWGDPWDMSQSTDVYIPVSSCPPSSPTVSGFSGVTVSGGIWSGTTITSGQSYFWLLNPGYPSSLNTGHDGQVRPIDTSVYRWISFKMYASADTTAVFYVAKGDLGSPPFTVSGFIPVKSGWNIYMIDMSKLMPSAWTGSVTGLRLDPALASGVLVRLDWVRLSSQQTTTMINWSGTGLSGNVTIEFDDASGVGYARLRYFPNGTTEQSIPAAASSFTTPASLSPSTYTVRVSDGGGSAVSADPWVFKSTPIAEVVAPSYTSGPDFAATVLGNPWDMSGADDIDSAQTQNLSYVANGGVLDITSLVNTGGCSAAHLPLGLNMHGQAVDSNTYKYLSYRYKADQTPNQGGGGVMRARWQQTSGFWPTGRTDDISLYHNQWQTYQLDLSQVTLEGEMADWKNLAYNVFQIMVHESSTSWTSHLDWVRLTAENTAQGSYLVKWNLAGATGVNLGYSDEVTATIYWATKSGSTYTPIGSGFAVPTEPPTVTPPPGPLFVYLPIILKNYGVAVNPDDANFAYSISTAGLTVGQSYYVALRLQDGYNTVWWYSELPVRIQ